MTKRPHNRSLLALVIVLVMVIAVRLSSFVFPQRIGSVDPHINLPEDRLRQIADAQRGQQIAAFIAVTEGEVSRTEERIREATALATAASLFAASETLKTREPANTSALLIGIKNAELIPPGLQLLDAFGNIGSDHAKLILHYRPEPLGVEVVSVGKVPLDGPVVLVRVPANGTNKQGASLYIATSVQQTNLPTPFASEAEIFALGFAIEPLRASKLPTP